MKFIDSVIFACVLVSSVAGAPLTLSRRGVRVGAAVASDAEIMAADAAKKAETLATDALNLLSVNDPSVATYINSLSADAIETQEKMFITGSVPLGLKLRLVELMGTDSADSATTIPQDLWSDFDDVFTDAQQNDLMDAIVNAGLTDEQRDLMQYQAGMWKKAPTNGDSSSAAYWKLLNHNQKLTILSEYWLDSEAKGFTPAQVKAVMQKWADVVPTRSVTFTADEQAAYAKLSASMQRTLLEIHLIASGGDQSAMTTLDLALQQKGVYNGRMLRWKAKAPKAPAAALA